MGNDWRPLKAAGQETPDLDNMDSPDLANAGSEGIVTGSQDGDGPSGWTAMPWKDDQPNKLNIKPVNPSPPQPAGAAKKQSGVVSNKGY